MKITIDTDKKTLIHEVDGRQVSHELFSKKAFELLSYYWMKVGWNQKYQYTFSWLGRPVIQLPEDLLRVQEVIYKLKPDVIIETGIAHGGSLIFYATLCKAIGKGKIIGIDIEIRPHNRKAIESHELSPFITLIEADSTNPDIVKKVKSMIKPHETVLVVLDSNHSKEHVLKELELYNDLVTPGSYIVATDGVMRELHDVPRGYRDWSWDNPSEASKEFVRHHPDFLIECPEWQFNESELSENITHWTGAWIKRKGLK